MTTGKSSVGKRKEKKPSLSPTLTKFLVFLQKHLETSGAKSASKKKESKK